MSAENCEPLIRVIDVPALAWLPSRKGRPIHAATVYRWVTRGVRGRRLRTVRVGGVLATSETWLWDFFGINQNPGAPLQSHRKRSIQKANAELEAAGI